MCSPYLLVNSWCRSHHLKHLGVPMFLGSGSFDHKSSKLRFLVMERFGKDVDELFLSSGRRFDVTTVLMLGLRVVSLFLFSWFSLFLLMFMIGIGFVMIRHLMVCYWSREKWKLQNANKWCDYRMIWHHCLTCTLQTSENSFGHNTCVYSLQAPLS